MANSERVPTGQFEDGTLFFREDDLKLATGVSLSLFPPGDAPLVLYPSSASTSNKVYSGKPTHITCYVTEDDSGATSKIFRCKHEIRSANVKKGVQAVYCTHTWKAGNSVTIGSIRSHCRSKHWDVSGSSFVGLAGQNSLFQHFPRKKKQRINGGEEDGGISNAPNENAANEGVIEIEGSSEEAVKSVEEVITENSIVEMEHIVCNGLSVLKFCGLEYGDEYELVERYPWTIHSKKTQAAYTGTNKGIVCNLAPKVDWTIDVSGNAKALDCEGIITRDRNNPVSMNCTTSKSGEYACIEFIRLQFNQNLVGVLKQSIDQSYGRKPNNLCPPSVVNARMNKLRNQLHNFKLSEFNNERKIQSLSQKVNDNSRLMLCIQENDVPALRRLMTVHIRNGKSVKSFIDKLQVASDYNMVGHNTYRRSYIQRGKFNKEGQYDSDAYKTLLMTILMSKLGCNKLVHTYSFAHGGLSKRQMQRHINEYGTVPHFRPRLSSCIVGEQGLKAIEANMDDMFANAQFTKFLPEGKWLASLHIDGINIDEMVGLDDDQLPHQITGLCRHNIDATYNEYADAKRVKEGLNNGTHHLAKEAEMFCIGLNHPEYTNLMVVAISPTCKKDDIVGESTNTVQAIVTTIARKWKSYAISKRLIMATYNSDGAGQFRKGVCNVLDKDLPLAIRKVYIGESGNKKCLLLNLVGGEDGTTASCDNDHLGKRFRARIKTASGITVGTFNLTKVELTHVLHMVSIVKSSAEAQRLFDPEDLMDVTETVRCLHAVGRLSKTAFTEFPADWRVVAENNQKYRELRLLGRISLLMCASIVGHFDNIESDGNHLSVSQYLTSLSELGHLLFVVFRRHKTSFIAAQNYRNWQEMIKNMFISVTLAKINGVTDFYWFLNTNKRIEEFFGILRSLRGGDMNFDASDLKYRVGDASLVGWIYAQHPELDQSSRHLQSSADRKNTRSWRGDTKVANVDEVECWNKGKQNAVEVLRDSLLFEEDELDIEAIVAMEPGVDMFKPYSKTIGVLAGLHAEYSLVNLEDADDDNEPEE